MVPSGAHVYASRATSKDVAGGTFYVAALGERQNVGHEAVRSARWLGALAIYHSLLAFMVQPLVLPKDTEGQGL